MTAEEDVHKISPEANDCLCELETEPAWWNQFYNGTTGDYVVFIYLPGCDCKNIQVEIGSTQLQLCCLHPQRFLRTFILPVDALGDKIDVSYSNNVLTMRVPRSPRSLTGDSSIEKEETKQGGAK